MKAFGIFRYLSSQRDCANLCTILKEQSKEMKYDNYIPSDILKPFVRSLAVQETAEETDLPEVTDRLCTGASHHLVRGRSSFVF